MPKALLCRPRYFRVDYKINPWMRVGTVDQKKAEEQWQNLKKTYEFLGVTVQVVDQAKNLPDMVFAADYGLVQNKKVLLGNFRFKERQGESGIAEDWFIKHGFVVKKLPKNIYFEGGDLLRTSNKLFLGTCFRTSRKASALIAEFTNQKAISLKLVDPKFFHLDTCLFILDDETAFYFPNAFSITSQNILKKSFKNLFKFTKKETENFAANSITVRKTVLISKGNENFARKISQLGYKVKIMDVSEFLKAGGGVHCLTLFLS